MSRTDQFSGVPASVSRACPPKTAPGTSAGPHGRATPRARASCHGKYSLRDSLPLLAALLVGIGAAAPAYCQPSGVIGGYTLGFVFDPHCAGLKPLVGIPGAAVLGPQLNVGVPIRRSYISPLQNFAIALTAGDAQVVSLNPATGPPAASPLGFDSSAANVVALSSDGSTGAFYSVGESLIRVVTGLPGSPVAASTVPAGAVSGTIRLLAISNDATALVAVVDTAGADAVLLLDAAGNGRTLLNSTHVSAAQFIGASTDLLLADDQDDTVSLVQDVSGSALSRVLAGAVDGIAGPVGLNVTLDRNLVVVANGRSGSIFVFDPNGATRATYTCPCTPSGLNRLNGNSVFLLNGVSDHSPLWLFDGDNATPRILFIPVSHGGTSGAGQ